MVRALSRASAATMRMAPSSVVSSVYQTSRTAETVLRVAAAGQSFEVVQDDHGHWGNGSAASASVTASTARFRSA